MSPSLATFVFETLNFGVLAAALGWAFSGPMRRLIAKEAAERERATSDVSAARASLDQSRLDLEARLATAEREVESAGDRARAEAEKEAAHVIAEARERIVAERLRSERDLESRRRAELDALLADAARAAAKLVLQVFAAADEQADALFVRAAKAELAKLTVVEEPRLVIECARAPTEKMLAELERALGVAVAAAEVRVVPELVAGARVTSRAGMVDASARGLARYAEVALQDGDAHRG